ncbi:hypothetical protein ABC347_09785 [Sphingomonas sp. 1P06PA]|uniref:hypothetical protein n=1 Tax=Sphingomonas sp. 1P06PA TaxID=554121 RepID=UPI0039A4611C
MIASRFRSLVWVGVFATTALGCYVVTQRVAGERAELAKLERSILAGKREVRRLETELDTRGRLPQLERWNQEVLALTPAKASQFLAGELQLASLDAPPRPLIDPSIAPAPAAVQLASAPARAAAPVQAAPVPVSAEEPPMLRQATFLKPKGEKLAAVRQTAAIDDDGFAAELERMAAREARQGKRDQ